MGETRVDLLHLLEDLRDAYPGSTEETILTEIVANALASGVATITLAPDPARWGEAIDGRFTLDELKSCCDPGDQERHIGTVADLTLGEYIRLLENPDRWKKLEIQIDRGIFVGQLQKVREIRNDVMHFDPDPFPEEDLNVLRRFVRFFQRLRRQGCI